MTAASNGAYAVPAAALLTAPAPWRCIDFVSDVHLHPSMPRTLAAFCRWLHETEADALFILGDLFEVWVGDDMLDDDPFVRDCADALKRASLRRPVHLMHGNRDFLMGGRFAEHAGAHPLSDPCVLAFAGERWLLTHGDALCTDDAAYLAFRAEVRQRSWQQDFLAQPLLQRQHLAASMRAQSRLHQAQRGGASDVNLAQVEAWLSAAQARVMIHGHTHQPADHALDGARQRVVLSDWDCDSDVAASRAQVLRLSPQGWQRLAAG